MFIFIQRKSDNAFNLNIKRLLVFVLTFSLSFGPSVSYAQGVLNLPAPGTLVTLSPSFNPPLIKGITIHLDDPFLFDFIVHPGDDNVQGEVLQEESMKLIKYFMAALTVPEDEMWVNLSPYEKNRIIPKGFGDTEMGRDLLAQDYMLKQLTASLMNPEDQLGSDFWNRVYKRAYEEFGTTEVPMSTFNKVWIVPEKAVIYENGPNIFVVASHLKVMLEEDYLALEANVGSKKHGLGDVSENDLTELSEISSKVIREIIIPEIEREVNGGKTFANLRQISNSVILATWYKQNIRQGMLNQIYINKNKTEGIDIEDKEINLKIYSQYIEAFKKGVYNFIKEDYDPTTQKVIPRKYFSGGVNLESATFVKGQMPSEEFLDNTQDLRVRLSSSPIDNFTKLAQVGNGQVENSDLILLQYQDHRQPTIPPARSPKTDKRTLQAQERVQGILDKYRDENKDPLLVPEDIVIGQARILGSFDDVTLRDAYLQEIDGRVQIAVVEARKLESEAEEVFLSEPEKALSRSISQNRRPSS